MLNGHDAAQTQGKNREVPAKFAHGWLDNLDQRLSLTQAMRERYVALTNDLGGVDNLSYAQRSLCERALWLEYWLADQERSLSEGKDFDVGKWTQACNALQGIYSKLGLERRSRTVDLADYLRQNQGKSQ